MKAGLVTFAIGAREYATPLAAVREVVRLEGLADLPGMTPPLAGVLDLRGAALPVLDLRLDPLPGARGDVLVLERGAGDDLFGDATSVGVAVDKVRAVVVASELPPSGRPATEQGVLPSYVIDVLRGAAGPVFLVDLQRMVDSARAGAR